jgi:hypothetical protein
VKVSFNENKSIFLNDQFSEIQFINLETIDENLIRKVSDIRFINNKLFIFSQAPDNLVSIHSSYGRYNNSYRKIGRGPGDINYAASFDVDTSYIYILDLGNRKVLRLTHDAFYYDELYLDDNLFHSIEVLKDNKMILFNKYVNDPVNTFTQTNSKLSIWEINSCDKLSHLCNSINLNNHVFIPIELQKFHFDLQDNIYYWDIYNDTIMTINMIENYNRPYKIIDFGAQKCDEYFNTELNKTFQEHFKIFKKEYAIISNFFTTPSKKDFFIISRYVNTYFGVLEKDKLELVCYKKMCLNNIHESLIKTMTPKTFEFIHYDKNSSIYFCWDTMDFIESFKNLKMEITKSEWEFILNKNNSLRLTLENVNENSNPILVRFLLKDTKE